MASETVRTWRPAHQPRLLLMAGHTTEYAMEPRAEYVFGIVAGQPMRSRQGRRRRVVFPGQLLALDPTSPHAGSAVDGRAWGARLMIVEAGDLAAVASDQETDPLTGITFPDPVLRDSELVGGFLRLHATLDATRCPDATRLEQEVRLAEWLRALTERAGPTRSSSRPLTPGDRRALRRASEYLAERLAHNVSLDELAAVAEIGKFRLVRLFRQHTGLPPHALQIAHRVRAARRLLEAGDSIADAAAATGFSDQSHLHRHFQRSLGVTPGEYQRRTTA